MCTEAAEAVFETKFANREIRGRPRNTELLVAHVTGAPVAAQGELRPFAAEENVCLDSAAYLRMQPREVRCRNIELQAVARSHLAAGRGRVRATGDLKLAHLPQFQIRARDIGLRGNRFRAQMPAHVAQLQCKGPLRVAAAGLEIEDAGNVA